jgi:hypothetical protein
VIPVGLIRLPQVISIAFVFSLVKKRRELPGGYVMKAKKSLAKVRRSANLAFSETQRAKIGVLQKMSRRFTRK